MQGCDHKLTNESVRVQQATMQGDTRARWHFFCLTQDIHAVGGNIGLADTLTQALRKSVAEEYS